MIKLLPCLFFIVFVTLHVALMIGLFLEFRRGRFIQPWVVKAVTPVSVIIPVHNEAGRIKPLLESLLVQDYPTIQIIFVDDRSTDDTVRLVTEFGERFTQGKHSCHIIRLAENPGPNYKQVALTYGFKEASGEFILLTDADCELPKTWVSGMVQRISMPDSGVVIGPVFKKIPELSFLYKTQAFDHAVRYMYLAASIGLGSAGGGFGNNMIVHKTALDSIGGYAAVPVSVTEDAAMISFIKSKTSFKVRAGFGSDIQVMTDTEPGWRQFLAQTLRWTKGGIFSPDRATRFSFTFLMGMIALGILALPLVILIPGIWLLPAGVYCAMSMNTLAVLRISGSALKKLKPIDSIAQLFIIPILNTLLTLMAILRFSVYWKGEKV